MSADVVVITGAGGGMGLACAPSLAPGGHLLLVDVNEDALDRAQQTLASIGTPATALVCDITRDADVVQLVEAIRAAGPLRALVHTAGVSPHMADGRRVLDVDLVGTARVLAALEALVKPGAVAVCVASIAGYSDLGSEVDELLDDPLVADFLDEIVKRLQSPLDGDTAYVLAKRGVMRLCERLAAPWGARGGRLVSVSPGLMDTGMGRFELEKQEIMQAMVDFTPVKRPGASPLPGRADDIAQLVAFLCSDAASFISGCDIRVDGGLVGAGKHMGFAS